MPSRPDDTVTLRVDGQDMTGWETVRITRSLDRIPSDFDIGMTDRSPTNPALLAVQAGMSCQVYIGADVIMSGWVDRVMPTVSRGSHGIRIAGRSLCADLVDCSVTPDILVGHQVTTSSLLELATRLTKPFSIPVQVGPGVKIAVGAPNGGALIFDAVLTETPWEMIERVARYVGVLIYDQPDGSMLIANVGTSTHASGFQLGRNVERAAVSYGMDARYSEYLPCLMSVNFFGAEGVGGVNYPKVFDRGVGRFRPLVVVSEVFQAPNVPLVQRRAQWEMVRRFGRSQAVHLTCDNWRDEAGALWAPNGFASIDLPAVKLTTQAANPWLIATVNFVKDAERGTVADIEMMPREAFVPEPTVLVPFLNDPTVAPPERDGVS